MAVDRGMVAGPRVVTPPRPSITPPKPVGKKSYSLPAAQTPTPTFNSQFRYLNNTYFERGLSQEAIGIAANTKAVGGLLGKVLGNSYWPSLNTISLGQTNRNYPTHEYTHAIAGNMRLEQNIYASATPDQIEQARQFYATTPAYSRAWNKNTVNEFAATRMQMAGGEYWKLPENLRSAYAPMFNQQTIQDVGRYRTLNRGGPGIYLPAAR